jgi:hypothetical protein
MAAYLRMALDGEVDQPLDQLAVGDAGLLPEAGVHRDGGEPGQRVDLDALHLAGRLYEEVDAGHPGAVQRAEGADRELLRARSGRLVHAGRDATLDTLTVTCSKTQLVGASTATWRVTVVSGGITHAQTTTAQTTDPTDAQIRWDASASTKPITITIRYEFIVDGITQINLSATFDPGDLLARGVYGPPPAQQGA